MHCKTHFCAGAARVSTQPTEPINESEQRDLSEFAMQFFDQLDESYKSLTASSTKTAKMEEDEQENTPEKTSPAPSPPHNPLDTFRVKLAHQASADSLLLLHTLSYFADTHKRERTHLP